ncbi:MAG: hypothetical protein KDD28_00330, partial [Phaeodactylibacter sp.]|nr:hypothetical protein [Phaeodactylibacter sp.]
FGVNSVERSVERCGRRKEGERGLRHKKQSFLNKRKFEVGSRKASREGIISNAAKFCFDLVFYGTPSHSP